MANNPDLLAVSHAAISTLVIGETTIPLILGDVFQPAQGTNEWEVEGDVGCSARRQVDQRTSCQECNVANLT